MKKLFILLLVDDVTVVLIETTPEYVTEKDNHVYGMHCKLHHSIIAPGMRPSGSFGSGFWRKSEEIDRWEDDPMT
jgi:hypothetical protein